MTRPLVVVPHGTGIGDFVNLRPLVDALVHDFPDRQVKVLGPASHFWLLPEGAKIVPSLFRVRTWTRPAQQNLLVRLVSNASVRQIGPLRHVLPRVSAARLLTLLLRVRGYEPVNLLETFARLDLDRRWTAGPWSQDRDHLIDALARSLEERGIMVSPASRNPRLYVNPIPMPSRARVVLSPGSGSSLKEAPAELWQSLAHRLAAQGLAPAILRPPGSSDPPGHDVPGTIVVGHRDLRVVAGMIASAEVVVSPDSGILHLAAALGRPWVGLFGATDPLFLGPYRRDGGVILQAPAEHLSACQGCWAAQMLPSARCALYAPGTCLSQLDVEVVERAVLRILDAGSSLAPSILSLS